MKKISVLFLSLAVFFLAGCVKKQAPTSDDSAKVQQQTKETAVITESQNVLTPTGSKEVDQEVKAIDEELQKIDQDMGIDDLSDSDLGL